MLSPNQKYEYNLILQENIKLQRLRNSYKYLHKKRRKKTKPQEKVEFLGLSLEEQKVTNKLARGI